MEVSRRQIMSGLVAGTAVGLGRKTSWEIAGTTVFDGERAGFINPEFDLMCMEKLVSDPDELTLNTRHDLIAQAGTQGSELIMWMMMRGALSAEVTLLHQNYRVPISNTGAGTMLLACQD